ncbi:MAG: hypothetical protein ACKVLF_02655 [Nitrospinaceae bacterium]
MRVFILSIVLLFASSVYAKSFGDYEGAIYLRNYDGDTIIFNPPGLPPIINEKIAIRKLYSALTPART